MVHLVRNLPSLFLQLKHAPLPKAIFMMGLIKDAMEGKLGGAKFYTDFWPRFSAIVCQWESPRVSDVTDLNCYATSSEALLELMMEGKFLTWGKRQIIHNIETEHAEYLMKHAKDERSPSAGRGGRLVNDFHGGVYILPEEAADKINRTCPSGYKLGKLEPHHAHTLADNYTYFNGWENSLQWFKDRIRIFDNVAAFSEKDGSLAGWITHFPGREQSHLFTFKEHRNKGLGYAIKATLCKKPQPNKEYFPGLSMIADGNSNIRLVTKHGFVSTGFYIDNLITDVD